MAVSNWLKVYSMIFHEALKHPNWIKFAIKFRKEHANVALALNIVLDHGFSIGKIILQQYMQH